MNDTGIEILTDTPNGPVIEYGNDDGDSAVDQAAIEAGWLVNWETAAVELTSGRWRLPLVPIESAPGVHVPESARASWEVGDRVEGGAEGTEDHDTGRVIAVTAPGARAADDFGGDASNQPRVLVGWDTGVQTWHDADELFPEVR